VADYAVRDSITAECWDRRSSSRRSDMTRSRSITLLASAAVTAALAAGCGSAASAGDRTSGVPVASADEANALQQRFVSIVRTVSPAVVQIRTSVALGSGVVFDARGDVVTNAHVVGNATRFVVTLASGDKHPGTLVGRDAGMDLAVIRITDARPRPATFANSARVEVGDLTLAIGNPLGLRSSVTEGIVSAVGRSVPETDSVTLFSVIQTSAAINPGNSGGALVDLSGQVIGIPTLAAVDPEMGAEAPGIGFAIDSNRVCQIVCVNGRGRCS
jgi:putative serine protease PepD